MKLHPNIVLSGNVLEVLPKFNHMGYSHTNNLIANFFSIVKQLYEKSVASI